MICLSSAGALTLVQIWKDTEQGILETFSIKSMLRSKIE